MSPALIECAIRASCRRIDELEKQSSRALRVGLPAAGRLPGVDGADRGPPRALRGRGPREPGAGALRPPLRRQQGAPEPRAPAAAGRVGMPVTSPAQAALVVDAQDLAALLHVLGDAAEKRGDDDARRALRLAARAAEQLVEGIERLAEGPPQEEKRR